MRRVGSAEVAVLSRPGEGSIESWGDLPGGTAVHYITADLPIKPTFRPGQVRGTLERSLARRGPSAALRADLLALAAPEPATTVYVFRYLRTLQGAGLDPDPAARRVVAVDVDDRVDVSVATELDERLRGWARTLLGGPIVRLVRHGQARLLQRASRIYVVGAEDGAGFPAAAVRVLPNVPALPADAAAPPPSLGQDVLFVGTMNHAPNVDAMEWTLSQVWPRLAHRFPEAALRVVGRGDMARLRAAAEGLPRVRFEQDAPDLDPHYAAARVAICPVSVGAGSKIKVLEAAAGGGPWWPTAIRRAATTPSSAPGSRSPTPPRPSRRPWPSTWPTRRPPTATGPPCRPSRPGPTGGTRSATASPPTSRGLAGLPARAVSGPDAPGGGP
jgi:hypothetical protein